MVSERAVRALERLVVWLVALLLVVVALVAVYDGVPVSVGEFLAW